MRAALIGTHPGPNDLPNTLARATGTEGVWGYGGQGPSGVGLVGARTPAACTDY